MARRINIRPSDPGLNLAAETELSAARQGGLLEQLLGLATDIPARVSKARKKGRQKRAIREFVSTGDIPADLDIGTLQEGIDIRKAQKKNPLDEPLPEEISKNFSKRFGVPEPEGGFTRRDAVILIRGRERQQDPLAQLMLEILNSGGPGGAGKVAPPRKPARRRPAPAKAAVPPGFQKVRLKNGKIMLRNKRTGALKPIR